MEWNFKTDAMLALINPPSSSRHLGGFSVWPFGDGGNSFIRAKSVGREDRHITQAI